MGEYDLLLSEAFWMEQIIAACITAIVTLIVALIAVGPALRSTRADMKHYADNLARDHNDLKDAQKTVRQDIAQAAGVASFLRDAQIREDERREQLKGQQLDIQKTVDTLVAQQKYIDELKRENEALRRENLRLIGLLTPSIARTQENEQDEYPEPAGC